MIYFKIGLFGVSGSGKTFSGLRFAKGLVGDMEKVVLLNTEDQITGIYKKRLGNFYLQDFQPPYDPYRFIKAVDYFIEQKYECIIVDSVSHFWTGSGGMMDLHQKMGGEFRTWAKTNPIYSEFVTKIVKSPIHMIITGRKKTDYVVEQNEKGKMAPKKVGLADVMRDGFEYELTSVFSIDNKHMAMAEKDRTGLFMQDEREPLPFLITEKTGQELKEYFKEELTQQKEEN